MLDIVFSKLFLLQNLCYINVSLNNINLNSQTIFFYQPLPFLHKNDLLFSTNIFNTFLFLWLLWLFSLFLFSFKVKNFLILNNLFFLEKELNSLDDVIYVLFLLLFIFFFFFFGLFTFLIKQLLYIQIIVNLLVILFLIPTTMLYNFGNYFIINIKGSANSLSIVYELVLDYINALSFYLRIYIQLIRLVIISIVYYMYNHLVISYTFLVEVKYSTMQFSFLNTFLVTLRLVFEILHTVIIFLIQFVAFMVMVTWLFQFLFTCFVKINLEKNSFNLKKLYV